MAGPWDNVQLPGPPNGPAYIQAAMQAMQGVGNTVNNAFGAYQKGQDFQYQQQQRNFFQDPNNQSVLSDFLKNPTPQNPAYASLLQSMIQQGGTPVAGPLISQMVSDKSSSDVAKLIAGGGGQQPQTNTGPGTSNAAASPANINGNFTGQPRQTAGNDYGGLNRIAADTGTDLDAFLTAYPKFKTYLDQESLSPGQDKLARAAMTKFNGGVQGGSSPDRGGDNAVAQAGTGNEITPSGTGGSSAQSPRQTGERRIAQNAPDTFNDRFGASYGRREEPRASPLGKEADAQQLRDQATRLHAIAAAIANRNPKGAEQADAKAKALEEQAKQISESVSKYNEPGRIQRDVESGATQRAEQIKSDTERFGKQYDAYHNRADNARQMLSTNQITKSIMDDPNYYSGTGADHVLTLQRLAVALGLKPQDTAMANEVFGKTVSSAILDQIRSLGGQGLGQVRVAEINVMKQAAQNHDNTPASNRLLTEMQDRMAQRWTLPIAEAAQQYNGGHLDAGFDQWKTQYVNQHPLFSKEELADPRFIAPPLARTPADLAKFGWRDGEPFRTGRTLPNGQPEIFTHAPKGGIPGSAPAVAPAFNPNGA